MAAGTAAIDVTSQGRGPASEDGGHHPAGRRRQDVTEDAKEGGAEETNNVRELQEGPAHDGTCAAGYERAVGNEPRRSRGLSVLRRTSAATWV